MTENTHHEEPDVTELTPKLLADLRRYAESWIMIGAECMQPLLDAFDAVCAERDALVEWRDFSSAEIASLTDRLAHMTEERDNTRAEVERLMDYILRALDGEGAKDAQNRP